MTTQSVKKKCMNIRQKQKEQTRANILQAAAICFAETGFTSCSMAQIAKQAKVSQGTLYVHFADKQALILSLIEQEYQTAIATYAALPKDVSLEEILEILAQCIRSVGFPLDHRLWISILAQATRNGPLNELQKKLDQKMRTALATALSNALEAPAASFQKILTTDTILILALIDGLIARKAIEPDFDIESAVKTFKQYTRLLLFT